MSSTVNDVRPFRALVYNPEVVEDVGVCLTQPYDVISDADQEEYYRRSDHSYIRLILGKELPEDNQKSNRYTRAAETLSRWRSDAVLTRSAEGFWLYRQEFALADGNHTTSGVIGVVRLQDLDAGRILPHEKVMRNPVIDRMKLTLATETQLEPIWSFYRDAELQLPKPASEPWIDYTAPDPAVRHRLWHVDDPEVCQALARGISETAIYIADGHHRYQTMLNVRDQLREKYPDAGPDAPWEYILMYLVNSAREELTVLPYHRVVHSLPEERVGSVLQRLEDNFDVTTIGVDEDPESARKRMRRELAAGSRFALAVQNRPGYHILHRPRGDGELGVEVLNDLVFGQALGITEDDMANQTHVDYTHSEEEALASVGNGQSQIAILMDSTTVEEIMGRADGAGVMPRKSSFFFPKPLSGLVAYPMERGD
jgi:uncharacterized protein (DUF1015 family)